MKTARPLALLTLASAAALLPAMSQAQTYPTKPVRIHAGGAGGSSDSVSRLVAAEISGPLGQAVLVENQPPATLAQGVARAAPDGYTLLITGGLLWIAPMFDQGEVTYDAVRDFAPITALTRQSTLLVVHPSVPAQSVAELIKLAKAQPGKLNYSSSTNGTSSHISGALFASMAGVDIVRVPYKVQNTETADLVAGRIQMTFGGGPAMTPMVQAGKLRALATSGARRAALYPDLPTVGESLPGYEAEQLLGMLAPAKTPEAIIRRLNQEAVRALAKQEVRDRLLKVGLEPGSNTPEEFAANIKAEIARVSKHVKEAGVRGGN